MSIGIQEACRALGSRFVPVLGMDIDIAAKQVFQRYFPEAEFSTRPLQQVVDGELGSTTTASERKLRKQIGSIDIVVGGPPCQGHSDLNNHTRRDDKRNALFEKMARFAEVVEPTHVVIENVLGVRHDAENVFDRTAEALDTLGYSVYPIILNANRFGVPQQRRRVFLIATTNPAFSPEELFSAERSPARTFNWACGDLEPNGSGIHTPSTPTQINRRRIDYLFEHGLYDLPDSERPDCHRLKDHTYRAVYGRLRPNEPAPTITTGFTVMGQGRFVHPHHRRTLTPREAARLQFIPDWFGFEPVMKRTSLARLIGNAVPPKLTYAVALELLR